MDKQPQSTNIINPNPQQTINNTIHNTMSIPIHANNADIFKKFNKEIIFASIMLIYTALHRVVYSKHKFLQLKELISDKFWYINFFIIIIFLLYIILYKKDDHILYTSLAKAIVAFIVAIYAELGLTIVPFWTIFVVAYFFTFIE